jgi:glucosamine 6-phosphate synthetase-like amidotransferase/phosphosugar isomerase protein
MTDMRTAHPYFLYDAVQEQPRWIEHVFKTQREKLKAAAEAAASRKRVVFIGIGTSLNAANVAERWMREHSGGRAEARAEQSFEFNHYPLALTKDDVAVVITHTGTTTQSIEALRIAKKSGALTIAITGQKYGEGISGADFHVETSDQEVAFAYTKSYTSALAGIGIWILELLAKQKMLKGSAADLMLHLEQVPQLMTGALNLEGQIRGIAPAVGKKQRMVFFGAGPCWATACEAALKFKETSYTSAEGFETEEILHGPFSEIDSSGTMVGLLAGDSADDRARTILKAAGEIKMLRIAVATPKANRDIDAENVLQVPEAAAWLAPFVHLVPLQLLNYHVGLARGVNPDSGRQDQAGHASAHKVYKL